MARENIQQLEAVVRGCPHDFDLYLLLALNRAVMGRVEEAIDDLTYSLRTADRPEIYFDRGMLHLKRGNVDAAMRDLEIAGEFAPEYLNQVEGTLRSRIEERIERRRERATEQ